MSELFISCLNNQFWILSKSICKLDEDNAIEYYLRSYLPESAFNERGVSLGSDVSFRFERGIQDLIVLGIGESSSLTLPFLGILRRSIKTMMLCNLSCIPDYAFNAFCKNQYLIVQDTEQLGEGCFSHQHLLVEADLSLCEALTEIPSNCFSGNRSLKEVYLPDSIQSIRTNAFTGCDCLETIYFVGQRDRWKEVMIEGEGNESLKKAVVICLVNE